MASASAALSSRARWSPEGPEPFLLFAGYDAVAHGVGDALLSALLEGAFNVFAGGVGTLGDGREGLPEGCLVEGMGRGGLGCLCDHLLPARPVGLLALRVVSLQEVGLLAAVTAGAAN